MTTWAIVGCGYVGERLLRRLGDEVVIATTRSAERARALGPAGRVVAPAEVTVPDGAIVVHSVPPFGGLAVPRNTGRFIYLSATSVYGDAEEVDEDTPAVPANDRGRARLDDEARVFASGVEAVSLRIAAIYGPGRGVQERLRAGGYKVPDGYVSRIHVDDLVEVIVAAGTRPLARSVYVVADDEPTPARLYADAVAAAMGLPPPPSGGTWEGRRVKNARMKAELGVRLRYPTWREGLPAILATRG